MAELGAFGSKNITYAVARTYSPGTINKDRASFLRRLKEATDGGIWTIEKGETLDTLHVNIVAGSSSPMDAQDMAKMWPSDADIWAAEVEREQVRNVAAYCSKRRQIPGKEDYAGNVYGSFGGWKRPLDAMIESDNAIVSGMALEAAIKESELPEMKKIVGWESEIEREEKNARAIREIDRAQAAGDEARRDEAIKQRFRLLYRVHKQEFDDRGFIYVPGEGIIYRDQVRNL